MSSLLGDLLSSQGVREILGPNGFVLLETIPGTYWWLMGMSVVVGVMAISFRPQEGSSDGATSKADSDDDSDSDSEGEKDGPSFRNLTEEEARRLNVMGRMKTAKQKTIRRQIEETLTPEEREQEQRIQSQQLAQIYALMQENKEQLGDLSISDLKNQMNMYTSASAAEEGGSDDEAE